MCLCCRDWGKKDDETTQTETQTRTQTEPSATRTQTKTAVKNVTRNPTVNKPVTRTPTVAARTAMPTNTANTTVTKADSNKGTDVDAKVNDAQVSAMIHFVEETVKKGIDGLKKEYEKLGQPKTLPSATFKENMMKNRYGNIPCFEHNRVKLTYESPPETDYIHANFIESKLVKLKSKFICTQGPIDRTINDFWRMVVQTQPKFIVMLCKVKENDKPKCAEYWPAKGETMKYGTVTVINEGDASKGDEQVFRTESLRVKTDEDEFVVKHITWTHWPDFGIPKTGLGMLRVLRKIDVDSGTAIVHCSAGIGRTGTLIAAEITMKALQGGKKIKVPEVILELRGQRYGLVQTISQYIYLHFSLCTYCERKLQKIPSAADHVSRLNLFFTAYKEYANTEELEDRKLAKANQTLRGETDPRGRTRTK